ncbi:MAG: cytochrome c [Azovibrio sp.]|uniref:c-type cytochrome n=1 Tax=Azovibrio sp. TaxID=1872673 RepID=UPI003C73F5BF
MKRHLLPALILGGLSLGALADDADLGALEYRNSCAACHGLEGKGGTEMGRLLRIQPPDLTLLQQKNGGVFPTARVYNTIDGRLDVQAHGSRAMPVWGQRYTEEVSYLHSDPLLGERTVRVRILALIDYLYRLQR